MFRNGIKDIADVKKGEVPPPPKAAEESQTRLAPGPVPGVEKSKPANKLNYKEQRELEELPKIIEALEREQSGISAQLADGAIYRSDAKRARQLQMRIEEIETAVSSAMVRWEELEKRRE